MTAFTTSSAAVLLDRAVQEVGPRPDLDAVRGLADWMARAVTDLRPPYGFDLLDQLVAADAESRRTGEGVVLAEAPTGHVMVVRYFPEAEPTPIHGHGGWGAVLLLRGRCRYETWRAISDEFAELVSSADLGAADTLAWADPPDDVHRQIGLAGGATELTIFKCHPFTTQAPQFQPAPDRTRATPPRSNRLVDDSMPS